MQIFNTQTAHNLSEGNIHIHTRLNLVRMNQTATQPMAKPLDEIGRVRGELQNTTGFLFARRGFLDGLITCGTCAEPYHWDRDSQAYTASHQKSCQEKTWLPGFQAESLVACELKKWLTPAHIGEVLRYQDHLRTQLKSEQNRLMCELELLHQQSRRHYYYRANPDLISPHQLQLHAALESANERRIAYLEAMLKEWRPSQNLLNDEDALALCILARDFGKIWSEGTRAIRRRVIQELNSELRISTQNQKLHLDSIWKIEGFGHSYPE